MRSVLFADSNVMIEALLIPQSAAYIVANMVARGVFDLATLQLCIDDAEDALGMVLKPNAILSNNRDHFNDAVAERCGIQIYSCQEFIEFISDAP